MRDYIRMRAPGATLFLTLVTYDRAPILTASVNVPRLRNALAKVRVRHPFEIHAAAILPDHLHLMIELPAGDADFSTRMALSKANFSRSLPAVEPPAGNARSRTRRRERAIWQRRFWEHTIRDENDYAAHMDYIHYNPVKHELAACPHEWEYSSFHRWVRDGRYARDWACSCRRAAPAPKSLERIRGSVGE